LQGTELLDRRLGVIRLEGRPVEVGLPGREGLHALLLLLGEELLELLHHRRHVVLHREPGIDERTAHHVAQQGLHALVGASHRGEAEGIHRPQGIEAHRLKEIHLNLLPCLSSSVWHENQPRGGHIVNQMLPDDVREVTMRLPPQKILKEEHGRQRSGTVASEGTTAQQNPRRIPGAPHPGPTSGRPPRPG
jgi:hypothetical protein